MATAVSGSRMVDMFLKIDGIDGESQDSKHKNEIEVQTYSFGSTQTGAQASGGGGGSGKVQMHDFHFTMKTSQASPKLFLHCANGKHIPKVVLTGRKAGGEQQEYQKITLSDVLVSSFQMSGAQGDSEIPVEQITLNFAKIEMEYKEQKPDGSLGGTVKTGWNLKQNAAA
jgi:type VI secretion system secreted protein Hcp